MIHRFRAVWVGLAGIVALAGASSADVLHLKTGGRLEGVITLESSSNITIDVGMGLVSVPRSSVLRIERKEGALSEYRTRLRAIGPGNVRGYSELARFANENGLRSESRLMWARVLSLDPMNVEAHLALGHVLVGGNYVDEDEAYRAKGFVYFDGRWMTPAEQSSLLREREQRTADQRVDEARRATRDAEDRAQQAEAELARTRAAAASSSGYPVWGYGSTLIVGSPRFGGSTSGCFGASCSRMPPMWPRRPATPVATPSPQHRATPMVTPMPTPRPQAPPLLPARIR